MMFIELHDVSSFEVEQGDILDSPFRDAKWLILSSPRVTKGEEGTGVKASFLVAYDDGRFEYHPDEHLGSANRFRSVLRYVE